MFGITGLTEAQIAETQQATEHILAAQGFRIDHAGLRQRCRAAGALVDDATGDVRFPVEMVRERLALVPREYRIADVDGREVTVGGDHRHGHAIVTDPWIIDYATQQPRRPTLADMRTHTIIGQRLDFIKAMSRMDFPVSDIEGPNSSLRALEEHLLHQNKHIYAMVTNLEQLHQFWEIGEILLQGRPLAGSKLMSVAVAPLTPLQMNALNAELLLEACARHFAVLPTSCPMAGTTAPYSLAGTLLMGHVENVALAVLAQIINPGNPFLYSYGPSVSEMHNAHDLYYTLDKVLWKAASIQLARAAGLPTSTEVGGTMTFRYDQQSGAEGMLFMLAGWSAGAHMYNGFGSCHNAIGMSAEMMVIHASWLHAAQFLARGIRFDDGRLGTDNIMTAGPGGNYLMDDLTLELLRGDEFFQDELFDHTGGFAPSISLLERAHAKVEALTRDFTCPLAPRVQEDLRAYFARQYDRTGCRVGNRHDAS